MDSSKSKAKGKSLRMRGKEILGASFKGLGARLSAGLTRNDSNISNLTIEYPSLVGEAETHQPQFPYYPDRERFVVGGSTGEFVEAPDHAPTPEFLSKSPDPDWIDIEMMGHWLQKCDKEHGEPCTRPIGDVPSGFGETSLLIDVQRKCLTSATPWDRSRHYVCLSYVWGGADTLKTGRDNLSNLMEENSLEARRDEIPRTIRDTINLIDQLGIPYLWVDSLCIIQDDTDSKHDQIQAMAGIYANAYVTVIAGNGWDADHGLRGIQGVTEPRQLSSFLKSDFEENLQPYSSIWYSRGWTFQEMIFSPRKIMFQYQLAILECNCASWHEASLSKITDPLSKSGFKPSISPWQAQIKISGWPNVKQYIALVQDYTRRKLTYPDDAFPAIASLLSVMSTSFSSGFISGLPEMFFDEALLWQPGEPMQRRSTSTGQDHPPSWSWAAWEGEIMRREWEEHFCHLPTHGWNGFTETRWTKGLRLSLAVENISNISPMTRCPFPQKWIPDGPEYGYVFADDPISAVAYPLPIPVGESPRHVSARYLFCRTTRAYFKSTPGMNDISDLQRVAHLSTILQDKKGDWVGTLNLNLAQADFRKPPHSTEYELVVISAGTILCKRDWALHLSTLRELSPGTGWGNFRYNGRKAGDSTGSTTVEFYYVLWIEWEDGIAYRRGLGRVLKEAWASAATDEIDLILG